MQCLVIILLLVCAGFVTACDHANVCKTFPDYYSNRDQNPNCYCNPDAYLTEEQIITRHGYPLEIHEVITEDGYILSIFRIRHGKNATGNTTGPPTFLQHGFLGSSSSFYLRGNTSLAFLLADLGYDVWLGNFRGVRYSRKHLHLDVEERAYWNFTFHEMGMYDLPAQLDHVARVTQQKMIYIGYSMGTTAYYIYASEYPDAAATNIRLAISLASIAALPYVTAPARLTFPFWPIAEFLLYQITNGPIIKLKPFKEVIKRVCLPLPIQMKFCNILISTLYGYDPYELYPEFEPLLYLQLFDESSIKTFTHFVQLTFTTKFQQFDYGKNNMAIYGTSTPPIYPLGNIKVPTYLIRGNNDLVATKQNVELLYSRLSSRAKPFPIYVVKFQQFSHLDFVRAKDVMMILYDHLLDFLTIYGPQFT